MEGTTDESIQRYPSPGGIGAIGLVVLSIATCQPLTTLYHSVAVNMPCRMEATGFVRENGYNCDLLRGVSNNTIVKTLELWWGNVIKIKTPQMRGVSKILEKRILGLFGVFLFKLINSSGSINQYVFTGVKRMACV